MIRVLFAGTPEVAIPTLEALLACPDLEVVSVLTNPDAPNKRGKSLVPSPVKVAAKTAGVEVLHEMPSDLSRYDLGVVVAYGQLIKKEVLDSVKHGFINLHFSLLPQYRGAAPVQRAILYGETYTGISIFKLQPSLDDGPIYLQRIYEIKPSETSGELLQRLAKEGSTLIPQVVQNIAQGIAPTPQIIPSEELKYARKLLKSEARIDWTKPAEEIVRQINAYSPNPGSWFEIAREDKSPIRVVALKARLGDSSVVKLPQNGIELLKVKPAGKAEMSAEDWARGLAEYAII